jgi:Flp pilus assembly protein TadG
MQADQVLRRHSQPRRGQRGQTLVIIAFLVLFMILLLGLVIDSARLYIVTAQAERAAEAGALAGALYMPNYFNSASNPASPDGHNATERACAAVQQNGITNCPVSMGQIGATPVQDAVNPYKLEVTVTIQADVFFLSYIAPNLSNATVSRTAAAQYLPPIQLGARTYYFGDEIDKDASGNPLQYFWARLNGPYGLKENGDAFTPKWEEGPGDAQTTSDTGGPYIINRWPSSNVQTNHPQWPTYQSNSDLQPSGFTGYQGFTGYNYEIVVPPGTTPVEIRLYNPTFDPPLQLDPNTPESLGNACSDPTFNSGGCKTDQQNEYLQMAYTLYSAPLLFERSADTPLTHFAPPSLDLYQNDLSTHTCTLGSQGYDPQRGICVSLPSYIAYNSAQNKYVNSWYTLPITGTDQPYIINTPGTYRLALEATGYYGYHQYAVKVTDTSGNAPPAGVRMWAWNDECVYFNKSSSDSIFDLGEIPAAYAGKTLNFSLFDPGDGGGNIYIRILDPSGNPILFPSWVRPGPGNDYTKIDASNAYYNALWLHIPVSIPANYNPTPGNDWWQIEYIDAGGTPTDTVTISVTLSGSPIHLVQLLD